MKAILKVENIFIGLLMLSATIILFVNIILRYFFDANTTWAEEFIRYAFIYITFIGGAVCFSHGIHFGVDLFINLFNEKKQKFVQLYINMASIVFMALVTWLGIELVIFSINSGQVTPSLGIELYWIYLAIPIGSLLSILHLIMNTKLLFSKEGV